MYPWHIAISNNISLELWKLIKTVINILPSVLALIQQLFSIFEAFQLLDEFVNKVLTSFLFHLTLVLRVAHVLMHLCQLLFIIQLIS